MSGWGRATVSVFLDDLGFFDPELGGLTLHGANLTASALVRGFARRAGVFEVFLPPHLMAQGELLRRAAEAALSPERFGKGHLRFYPFQQVGAMWADGAPRVLFSVDPERMPYDRYLRDRYAVGPMPLLCDTHAHAHNRLLPPLARLAAAPPVSYDALCCLSEAYREAMRLYFEGECGPGRAPCRLEVLPHGVNAEEFHPAGDTERRAARRALELPEDGTVTLYLGRVTPFDKAELLPLVDTFAAIASPTDRLVIAGRPHPEEYLTLLRERGRERGLGEDRLRVMGRVPVTQRVALYSAADIFVFPGDTVQEALGNTVLEAMASALPVVISDWDGFRDMVVDGETGFLVPTYFTPVPERISTLSPLNPLLAEYLYVAQAVWPDTGVLADRLRLLLADPELRRTMGQAGRRVIEERFTWAGIWDRWLALAEETLADAAREIPAERERRRAWADRLGHPTDYNRLFAHYATATVDPARAAVRLNADGRAVTAGARTMHFYDELLPLIQPEALTHLLETLRTAGNAGANWGELAEGTARAAHIPLDDAGYHIALLLKRGLLDLAPGGTFSVESAPASAPALRAAGVIGRRRNP